MVSGIWNLTVCIKSAIQINKACLPGRDPQWKAVKRKEKNILKLEMKLF